ncbi:MAG: GIY-YIG nuclease family protein, partial [Lactococcus lactis]
TMSCEWWFKHKLVRKQKLSLIKNDLIKEKFIEYLELKQKKNIHLK